MAEDPPWQAVAVCSCGSLLQEAGSTPALPRDLSAAPLRVHAPLCPLWATFPVCVSFSGSAFTPVPTCGTHVWLWATDWIALYLSFPIKWELNEKVH